MKSQDDIVFLYEIERFGRLFRQTLHSKLDPYEIRPGQIPLLRCLWTRDGVNQKELLAHVQVEQPTLANTLKRMQRDDLITVDQDPLDRRKSLYFLTDRGHKARKVVEAALDEVYAICSKRLSVTDIRYFRRILHQMTERLELDLTDPLLILADEVPDA